LILELLELGGRASSPIIKDATLLAVVDMGKLESVEVDSIDEPSSLGNMPPEARLAALAFPKLNFHFFLLAGAMEVTTEVPEGVVDTGGGDVAGGAKGLTGGGIKGLTALSKGVGRGYIDTGSYGRDRREEVEGVVDEPDRLESLDVLLSSRANDCEATARVANVSSFGVVGVAAVPLPFLAPRFLRL
jgi:hypothetical protein